MRLASAHILGVPSLYDHSQMRYLALRNDTACRPLVQNYGVARGVALRNIVEIQEEHYNAITPIESSSSQL